jgi:UDP-N-acetylmuramate-alanine ligase
LFHALNSYEGVVRRFDLRCDTGETVFIDDYAHHPEELNACIRATREIYPDRKITVSSSHICIAVPVTLPTVLPTVWTPLMRSF